MTAFDCSIYQLSCYKCLYVYLCTCLCLSFLVETIKFLAEGTLVDKSYPFQAVIVSLLKLSPFIHTTSDETEMKSDQ